MKPILCVLPLLALLLLVQQAVEVSSATNAKLQQFKKVTVDQALWKPNSSLVKKGSVTICSIECVLKNLVVCNGFSYDDATKECILGLIDNAATPTNTATVDVYKAV